MWPNICRLIPLVVSATALSLASGRLEAVELVCNGGTQQFSGQRQSIVDCASRKAVVDALEAGWQKLREERIGGSTEDMCWKAYQRALELHPSIPINNVAPVLFVQCNMALQYVK